MAKNTRVSCPAGVWTAVTDDDVAAAISIELLNDVPISLQATATGAATPIDDAGPLELLSYGDGWSEATIVAKFPGVASAVRLWAKPRGDSGASVTTAIVGISHAA